jgi:hypothetical protein
MKQFVLLILIGFIITDLNAQKIDASQVPSSILKDFTSKYASAKRVKWVKEEKNFEVEFMLNGKGIDVTYDTIGNWVETLSEISVSELPSIIVESVNKLFHDCRITGAARIDQYNKDALYESEIRFKGKKAVATFDTKGNQVD